MYLYGSNPALTRVDLSRNVALGVGGGMSLYSSSPALTRVNLSGNRADVAGGMYLSSSSPTLVQVNLVENTASRGGGMYLRDGSSPTLTRVSLTGNWVSGTGGGGGGMYLNQSSPILTQVTLSGNSAREAEVCDYEYYYPRCYEDGGQGGGIYMILSSPTLTQVTLVGNSATYVGGGMCLLNDSRPWVRNSVLAHNTNWNAGDCADYYDYYAPSDPSLSYVDFYSPSGGRNYYGFEPSATTYTLEPGFLSYDADGLPDDLHLALDSPLIDLGDPSIYDPDDSRSDLGAYGGPGAEDWDRDWDDFNDYFWPGTWEDAPAGFDPEDFDADDWDAEVL